MIDDRNKRQKGKMRVNTVQAIPIPIHDDWDEAATHGAFEKTKPIYWFIVRSSGFGVKSKKTKLKKQSQFTNG
jgi:hypothetical protein